MIKIAPVILIAGMLLSVNCHAEMVPIVVFDSKVCELKGWHNLGGCFQNMTGSDAGKSDLYLRQSIYYTDKRMQIVGTFPLTPFHAQRYVVISTSTDVYNKNKIKHVVDEVIRGKDGSVLPGCKFIVAEDHPFTPLTIVKNGDAFSCQSG